MVDVPGNKVLNLGGIEDSLIVRTPAAGRGGRKKVYVIPRSALQTFERTGITAADHRQLNLLFSEGSLPKVEAGFTQTFHVFDGTG